MNIQTQLIHGTLKVKSKSYVVNTVGYAWSLWHWIILKYYYLLQDYETNKITSTYKFLKEY